MWKRPRQDILTSSAPYNPSASRWSSRLLLASSAEVLRCSAEAVGVADAMIEAYNGPALSRYAPEVKSVCIPPDIFRKNSHFSIQDEHIMLLGLEVLTQAP